MKILPVVSYLYPSIRQDNINRAGTKLPRIFNTQPIDTVTFSAKVISPNKKAFRKLLRYDIPDMYTGKIMLSPDIVENFIKKGLFDKSIKKIAESLMPYKERLQHVEQEVLSIINKDAATNPDLMLSDAIKKHSSEANKKLLELQNPVFEELNELAKKLPSDAYHDFQELMAQAKMMLNHQCTVQNFNKSDFKYKLKRIANDVYLCGIDEDIMAIQKLMKMANYFPFQKFNKAGKPSNKQTDDLITKQSKYIKNMMLYFNRTSLAYNQELRSLFENAESQILGKPSLVAFSRKKFICSLDKILDKIDDKELAGKLHRIAVKLPTSQDTVSAFIVKASRRTSEKIGLDLLQNSVGSIEHLVPRSQGGKDSYANYGLSASLINSNRGSTDMQVYLREHPEVYATCQMYVDRFIELTNSKVIERNGIPKTYIRDFAYTMRRLSPSEKPMILDLSKLK